MHLDLNAEPPLEDELPIFTHPSVMLPTTSLLAPGGNQVGDQLKSFTASSTQNTILSTLFTTGSRKLTDSKSHTEKKTS
jgi:hypothetical protein